MTLAPLGVLCTGAEPGHPEEPHTDTHLHATGPGCNSPTPYCGSAVSTIPSVYSLPWHSTDIQHVTYLTPHFLFGDLCFSIFLSSSSLPSYSGCSHSLPPLWSPPPPLSSKKLGDVGLGWGQTMIKKKKKQVSDLMLST